MFYDKVFRDLADSDRFRGGDFERCTFRGCDLTQADFTDAELLDCRFEECRLSGPNFDGAGLRDAVFERCELRGVDFGRCRRLGFGVAFRGCHLSFCSFRELKMERTRFTGSVLRECFFSECDLAEADFSECDLERTLFEHCRLEGADFQTAFAFAIDPAVNRMRGARFSRGGLEGLLTQFGLRIEE